MQMKQYLKRLYSIDSLKETLKDKKVLKWLVGGIAIYATPAIYRAVTKNPIVPIFPLVDLKNPYIPKNLYEKLVVNFFAPGGIGAVIGEKYAGKVYGKLKGVKKYLTRVGGSVGLTGLWTSLQYLGYSVCNYLNYQWPSGGNPFESPNIYPFNILLALTIAPLSPYLIEGIGEFYKRLKKR